MKPRAHAVYALIERDEVVYVGCSVNPEARFRSHKAARRCRRDASLRIIRWYSDVGIARRYEYYYIQKLRPAKNVWGNRMPDEQARKIWHRRTDLSKKDVLKLMPGWGYYAAYYRLGPRGTSLMCIA